MVYPVIIIGGGFSGLILANQLQKDGINYLLLERNDRLGKKILATGNGRGNISNEDLSLNHYHSQNQSFCDYAIKTFDNGLIGGFFSEKGILLTSENGRLYPLSKQANAILDCLRLSILETNYRLNSYVKDITHNGKTFEVITADNKYYAQKVVLAVGGKSASHFGTDGSSYKLAQKFGHKLTKLYPSLVQLTTNKESVKGLKGVKENAKVTAFDGEKTLTSTYGDILFTDNGVSGNTIFYLSAYLSGTKNPYVSVDFLYQADIKECKQSLISRKNAFKTLTADTFLSGLVHSRISQKVAKSVLGEDYNKLQYKDLTDKDIDKLIYALKNTKITITGDTGFNNSQVTKGGIDTLDIDYKTMQSKLCKNLYLCGEVLDVDGDCGGYNLQWAFSSAMCAYRSIKGDL